MSEVVLDASAVIAIVRREPGAERVREALKSGAIVSAANHAEIISKLIRYGMPVEDIRTKLAALDYEVVPLLEADAIQAGLFFTDLEKRRLSLGDRCCIALAMRLGVPVLTADHPWLLANLDSYVEIELIR